MRGDLIYAFHSIALGGVKRKIHRRGNSHEKYTGAAAWPAAPPQATKAAKKKSTALQDAFKARLAGSRFRVLNEELYTMTSSESFDRFSARPDLFEEYHEGR